ncbi:flippase [Malikia spinosa]|uniref:flippase n=1 Tax=Malikia spinosa TaxID=86180 RepID=UPI0027B8CB0D|nr:flippase [Malikia spinosa]
MSISRNTALNLGGAFIPIALTLGTLPLYLNAIGNERFGVISIVWIFVGYFGLFDLGLGRATAQKIASTTDDNSTQTSEILWTALTINTAFGILGGSILFPIANWFFLEKFNIQEELKNEIIHAIPWMAVAVPLTTITGVITGALEGKEKFLQINIINITSTSAIQIIPLIIATYISPNLSLLLCAIISIKILTIILLFISCQKNIRYIYPAKINFNIAPELFKFGGWVTISSTITPLMVMLDRFMIGAISGATSVTYYTIPFNLASRITIIPRSLSSALFPKFANKNNNNELYIYAIKTLLAAITPLTIIGIIIMPQFLSWWISHEFALEAAPTGIIILIGLWTHSLAYIPYAQLQAKGKPDVVAKCHLVELPFYLITLYFALKNFGIIGAAVVWSVRASIDAIALFYLNKNINGIVKPVFLSFLMIITSSASSYYISSNKIAGIALAIISLIGGFALAWKHAPKKILNKIKLR